MSINDVVSFANIGVALVFAIIPIVILTISLIAPRGLYYVTITAITLGLFAFCLGYSEFVKFYIGAWVGYLIFYLLMRKKNERDGERFSLYEELIRSYYSDDLNEDGIIDAFENWKIAHDPRFSWIFASRKVREEQKKQRLMREEFTNFYSSADNDFTKSFYDFERRTAGRAGNGRSGRTDSGYRSGTGYAGGRGNGYAGSTGGNTYRKTGSTYAGGRQQTSETRQMSEEEKRVAAQHAFARRNNLRYFSMCTSQSEGKKLFRKYASMYHPDNPDTGNEEKFVMIDEEYKRFCTISDSDFPNSAG